MDKKLGSNGEGKIMPDDLGFRSGVPSPVYASRWLPSAETPFFFFPMRSLRSTIHSPALSQQTKPASRSGRDEGPGNHPINGLPGWVSVDGDSYQSVKRLDRLGDGRSGVPRSHTPRVLSINDFTTR